MACDDDGRGGDWTPTVYAGGTAADEIERLRDESARLKADCLALAERVKAQAELLSRRAEGRLREGGED